MLEQESIISSLEGKINKLLSVLNQTKAENQQLSEELMNVRHAIELKDTELKELNEKYENLKLARLLVNGGEDVHTAKLKVNKIVREIDKCIALLNK
jgi:chromosome segregation ATPase